MQPIGQISNQYSITLSHKKAVVFGSDREKGYMERIFATAERHMWLINYSSLFRYPEQEKIIRHVMERKAANGKPLRIVNYGIANGEELITQAAIAEPIAKKFRRPISQIIDVSAVDIKTREDIQPQFQLGILAAAQLDKTRIPIQRGDMEEAVTYSFKYLEPHNYCQALEILKKAQKNLPTTTHKKLLSKLFHLINQAIRAERTMAPDTREQWDACITELDKVVKNDVVLQKLCEACLGYVHQEQADAPDYLYRRYFMPPNEKVRAYHFSPAVQKYVLDALDKAAFKTPAEVHFKTIAPYSVDVVRINNVLQYMGDTKPKEPYTYKNPLRENYPNPDDPVYKPFTDHLANMLKLVKPNGWFMADLDSRASNKFGVTRGNRIERKSIREDVAKHPARWTTTLQKFLQEIPDFNRNFRTHNVYKGIYQRTKKDAA